MRKTSNVVLVLASFSLFFGISSPLLFSAQTGAFSADTILETETVYLSSTTTLTTISILSSSVPINALYVRLSYEESALCDTPEINENYFSLVLESSRDVEQGEITIAIASPGYGTTTSITVATLLCRVPNTPSVHENLLTLHEDSRAYAADGLGTELLINQ
jgi:hypothetical protein